MIGLFGTIFFSYFCPLLMSKGCSRLDVSFTILRICMTDVGQKIHADIITHRWDHETNKQGDEGFFGKVQAFRKKTDAKLVEKAVPSDPSKV